ncbi:MAG TPA: chloride channel protein [Anaeromyxobacteraceae bacterium]|nr:chloride channel protein [Anaeromyxobacteraceae bacterium]
MDDAEKESVWPGRLIEALRLRLRQAQQRYQPTERQWLFALTVVIGGACGLAAVGFHLLIDVVSRVSIEPALAAAGRSFVTWTMAVPALGGLVSGIFLQYLVPNARGSGIPQVKVAYAGRARLRSRDSVGKFLVGALQIGTGSSLGREGPTVQICAGLASRMGRLARVSPQNLRRLIPVGAAAGIAAAFNAPIAAVTFTIEEVVGTLDQTVLSGVIVAAAFAAIVERSVLGAHPVFQMPPMAGLDHASSLLLYAALGLVAAGLAIAFTDSLLKLRLRFQSMRRIPPWAQPAIGGLATGGLAAAALWWLGAGGVTGGGYATVDAALAGKLAAGTLISLCLMKLAATVLSYSSGGAGGIFAPALFIGAMAGGAMGTLDMALFHHPAGSLGAFAVVGMGAVFAGIIRAPITSVLIIIEMTGGYSLILPLMIANMLAYGIARHYRPVPIYEALLEQDGIHLHARESPDGITLAQAAIPAREGRMFAPATGVGDLTGAVAQAGRQEVFPVVEGDRVVGIIALEDLVELASEPHLDGIANAADVMRAPLVLRPDTDLRTAFELMRSNGLRQLPMTDAEGRVIGLLDESSIAHAHMSARTRTA